MLLEVGADKDFSELLKRNDANEIYCAFRNLPRLNKEQKNRLLSKLFELNDAGYIYLALSYLSWLDQEQKNQGFSKLVELKDAGSIYFALRNFPWLNEEQTENGVETIRTCLVDSKLHLIKLLLDELDS